LGNFCLIANKLELTCDEKGSLSKWEAQNTDDTYAPYKKGFAWSDLMGISFKIFYKGHIIQRRLRNYFVADYALL